MWTQKTLFSGWDELGSLGLHGASPRLNATQPTEHFHAVSSQFPTSSFLSSVCFQTAAKPIEL